LGWVREVKDSLARRIGGHGVQPRYALRLANPLVIAKDKQFVLDDRISGRSSELIAAEGRFCDTPRIVKEIGRIQGAIAQKLVDTSMKLIRPRPGDGVHYAARRPAVLGGIVAGGHGKLFDGVNA